VKYFLFAPDFQDQMSANGGGTATVSIFNPILADESDDVLYHFGLVRSSLNAPEVFGGVKVR
jgi:hypothetical protein